MEDERFKHIANDPKFKKLRKKDKKIVIDERFQGMFEDERFSLEYKNDKRGRHQKKASKDDLKKYYSLDVKKKEEQKEEEEEQDIDETDEDGVEDEETECSSSSDESESDEEDIQTNLQYDWQPLDNDAEKSDECSHRLAIQNLDWDHINVRDLYILLSSVRPPLSVRIYVSEFGKKRLVEEETRGPQEIIEPDEEEEEEKDLKDLENKLKLLQDNSKRYSNNEYEDADEAFDPRNEKIREKIRLYQLTRMKYYFAVAEYDSVESAETVYNQLDGLEFEGSSLVLDLRFVPNDIEFESADIKSECTKMEDFSTYQAPQFINSALQQTSVNLTWDQTDIERQRKLQKAYTKAELDKDDLDAYLASETDSDDEPRIQKYQELIQELADKEDEDREEKSDSMVPQADTKKKRSSKKKKDKSKKEDDFRFDPEDDRFKAIYESNLYNIDPSHPNFKKTEAFEKIAEKKRLKRA